MIRFLKSIYYDLQEAIHNGSHVPTKIENEVAIPKPSHAWNEYDEIEAQLNEYIRACQCQFTKEIQRLLEVIHERTNQLEE